MSRAFETIKRILTSPDPEILEEIRNEEIKSALPQKWLKLIDLIQTNARGEKINFYAAENILKKFIDELKYNLEENKKETFYFSMVKELLGKREFNDFVIIINEIYPHV